MATIQNPVMCPDCRLQVPITDNYKVAGRNAEKHGFGGTHRVPLRDERSGKPIGPDVAMQTIRREPHWTNPSRWT